MQVPFDFFFGFFPIFGNLPMLLPETHDIETAACKLRSGTVQVQDFTFARSGNMDSPELFRGENRPFRNKLQASV